MLERLPSEWLVFLNLSDPGYLVTIGYDIVCTAGQRNISHGQVFDENFLMMVATFGTRLACEKECSKAVAVMLFLSEFGSAVLGFCGPAWKSRQSISDMMNICPEYANIEEDGVLTQVDPDDVEVGTIIVVKPGERIPLDGIVTEGTSMIDTA
ncbi:MAG: hypothetical protein ACLRP8_00020 [Roseburia intestinalis]